MNFLPSRKHLFRPGVFGLSIEDLSQINQNICLFRSFTEANVNFLRLGDGFLCLGIFGLPTVYLSQPIQRGRWTDAMTKASVEIVCSLVRLFCLEVFVLKTVDIS